MRNVKEIVSVMVGDWEAIYFDGKCVNQGECLDWCWMADALEIPYRQIEADEEWFDEYCQDYFPDNLKNVKFKK